MGVCYSQPKDGDIIDDEQDKARLYDPETTTPVDYQIEPVVDPNQDTALVNSEVVVSEPSNETNLGHPQAAANEVVYPAPAQPQPIVSNDVIGVGNHGDYHGGRAYVNTIQDDGGVLTGAVVQNSIDEGSKVYDPEIGRMVYVLDENQLVDGLEEIVMPETYVQGSTGNLDRMEHGDQRMFRAEQTEAAFGSKIGYQDNQLNSIKNGLIESGSAHIPKGNEIKFAAPNHTDQNYQSGAVITDFTHQSSDFNKINDNQMQVVSMGEPRSYGYLHDGVTVAAEQVANKAADMVYDPMIGSMVQVLHSDAPLDGKEIFETTTVSYQ